MKAREKKNAYIHKYGMDTLGKDSHKISVTGTEESCQSGTCAGSSEGKTKHLFFACPVRSHSLAQSESLVAIFFSKEMSLLDMPKRNL